MAMVSNPTDSFAEAREHGGYRLDGRLIAVIEDIAKGVEEGESGLKSCAAGDSAASAGPKQADGTREKGVSKASLRAMQSGESSSGAAEEAERLEEIGRLLDEGYSHAEIDKFLCAKGGDADDGVRVHLLAIERWCELIRLKCDPDMKPNRRLASCPFTFSRGHRDRLRCRRTFDDLRGLTPTGKEPIANGTTHAAVLHIVYGWPDPFFEKLTPDIKLTLGREFGPIARYTDTVETKRQSMVWDEANERCARAGSDVVDLDRRRAMLRWCDQVISSGDAFRAGIAHPANEAAKEARKDFLIQVKVDANRMLSAASTAYGAAWRRN